MGFLLTYVSIICVPSLIIAVVMTIVDNYHEKKLKAKLEKTRQEAQQKALEEQLKKEQLRNSVKYSKLLELFEAFKPYREPIVLKLNTSAEFKKYDKMSAVREAYNKIRSKYNYLNDNNFSDKLKNILAISDAASDEVRKREITLITSIKQTIDEPHVRVIWSYVSPAGRNNYSDSADVTQEDLREYEKNLGKHKNPIDAENFRRERERQMLTKKMRFEIFQRDGFRCQICGRSAQDGVPLEVDHKKPIAKGGKTEPDNLWTLCRDCNRGKAAKYEE